MLSMKAKYALRAMLMLSRNEGSTVHISDIASEENVPKKFLEAILLDLKRYGLVESRRGALGGYTLAKKPSKITIGDIVRITDGPLAPIRCASVTSYQRCLDCKDETTCEIRKVMQNVRAAISGVLDRTSIDDMGRMSPDSQIAQFYAI